MKLLIALAALSISAFASVTITAATTPVSMRVAATFSADGYMLAGYEVKSGACPAAASLTYRTGQNTNGYIAGTQTGYQEIANLAPSTTYCVAALNTQTVEWSAVSEITTDAYTGGFPRTPTPATELALPAMPVIDGNTYTVTVCGDLQAALTTASALAGSLNHEVVITAGLVCTASFWEFPWRSSGGTGYIVVRTNTPAAQLPPEGTRYDPAIWPSSLLATIRTNTCAFLQASAAIRMTDPTSKWRFVGIEITGDPDSCNGLKSIASITPGATTTIEMSAAHGMITGRLAQVISAPGITGLTGTTYSVTVLDTTTFTVAASTSGTYTGSGTAFVSDPAFGSGNYQSLVAIADPDSHDIYFDRCYLHGEDFPYRTWFGFLVQGTNIGIFHSYLEKVAYPYLVVAGTNNPDNQSERTPVMIDLTECRVCRVSNNYISASGFAVYGQSDVVSQTSQNHVIDRNRIEILPSRLYRSDGLNPDSDGHYYIMRQPLEWKQIQGLAVVGNDISGTYYNAAPPGPSINLSMRGGGVVTGGPNSIDNVIIESNILRDGSGGIQITGEDDRPTTLGGPTQKILIENNLMYGLNGYYYKTTVTAGTSNYGFCWELVASISDIAVRKNTCWKPSGLGPMSFWFGQNRSGSMEFTSNLVGWSSTPNGGNAFGGLYYDQKADMLPVIAGGASSVLTSANLLATLDSYWQRNPAAGWVMANNVFVPLVKDGGYTPATYASTTLADMWNYYSLCDATNGVLKDLLAYGNRCAGSNAANDGTETANQRMTNVSLRDTSTANYRYKMSSTFAPYGAGADLDAIDAARGLTSNLRALSITSSVATLAYTAPNTTACTVEYGTSATAGTGTRVADTPAGQRFRTLALTGLTTATTYYYRVMCSVMQSGSFATI